MAAHTIIRQLKKDIEPLKGTKEIMAILLYGSHASGKAEFRSDVDICLVAPSASPESILRKAWRTMPVGARKYDVHVFEEFPLYLKMEVINNHRIIFVWDKYELYEYFYTFRKLWDEQKHRQSITQEEILQMHAR